VRVGRNHDVIESGIGVPVVGEISYLETLAKKYPLVPLNGGHLTLRALLQFEPAPKDLKAPRVARLHLNNPLRQDTWMLNQKKSSSLLTTLPPRSARLIMGFSKASHSSARCSQKGPSKKLGLEQRAV